MIALYCREESGLLTSELKLQRQCVEEKWRDRADNLSEAEIRTEVFSDLYLALEASSMGRTALVSRWLENIESRFLSVWEEYEKSDVLDEEVTAESILGHRFLLEGVEGWLDALGAFREGLETDDVNPEEILECAEFAQRRLILLQVLEREAEESLERYFLCYN